MTRLAAATANDVPLGRHTLPARTGLRPTGDRVFGLLVRLFGLLLIAVFATVVWVLVDRSMPAVAEFGLGFLLSDEWDPPNQLFGAKVYLFGTFASSLLAVALALPVALGTAIALTELLPRWLARPIGVLVELLAAVPSIIYGVWGVAVIVPFVRRLGGERAAGPSLLAAGIVLGIMILPIITAVTRDMLRAVPRAQREAALALGLTPWEVTWRVVLPHARGGTVAAVLLGFGRAFGETMAVILVIGNMPVLPRSVFDPTATIPNVIANEFGDPSGPLHLAALVELSLILLVVSLVVNVLAQRIVRRHVRRLAGVGVPTPRGHRLASFLDVPRRLGLRALQGPRKLRDAAGRLVPGTRIAHRRLLGRVAFVLCLAFAAAAVTPLLSVLAEVVRRGAPALTWTFLTTLPESPFLPGGGIWHAIVGTAMIVGLGTAMGAPAGVLAGIYLAEYGRGRFAEAVRVVANALAGIPSIVAGMFAFTVVVTRWGYSGYAGGVALALIMLPVVARTTEEALRTVPLSYREAALALGAPKWRATLQVVVPACLGAILTGLLLAVSRIAGETAPLLLTTLTSFFLITNPGDPVASLPFLVYDYGKSAYPKLNDQAWGAALVLITLVLAINVVVRLLAHWRNRDAGWGSP